MCLDATSTARRSPAHDAPFLSHILAHAHTRTHYTHNQLPDGRKFDSSRDREKPFKFKLGAEQVIPGLDEGVERLCMKERAKLFVPADKAYGRKGFPGLVPPNTNLFFDLELLTFR